MYQNIKINHPDPKRDLTVTQGPRQPRKSRKRDPEASHRTTIYLTGELLNVLNEQAKLEGSNQTRMIGDLLTMLLLSDTGQALREGAKSHRLTLAQEAERKIRLYTDRLPVEEIAKMAEATQRSEEDMIIRLVQMGLEVQRRRDNEALGDP